MRIVTKIPDKGMQTQPVDMDFHYKESFGESAIPEAYERRWLDAVNGDASLFARSDEIELAWNLVDSVHAGWESKFAPPLVNYIPGTWGPTEADKLLARDQCYWVHGCGMHEEVKV
jgi:glucose-6-phosphate 1-dehydrogenase